MCDSYDYTGQYIFDTLFDPNGDVNDEDLVELYESYSPIFISENKGPMIFVSNNFS